MVVPPIEWMLVAGRAAFLIFSFVLAAITFTRWRGASQKQGEQILAQHDVVLQRLAAIEARIDATKASIAQLGRNLDQPAPASATIHSPAAPGYQIAIRLAKSGATREQLVANCGLSIREAELVQRLHGLQSGGASGKSAAPRPHAA